MITLDEETLMELAATLHYAKERYKGNKETEMWSICPLCEGIDKDGEGCSCDNDD